MGYTTVQTPVEQDLILAEFAEKVAGSSGRKLTPGPDGAFLDMHNMTSLRDYLVKHCCENNVLDCKLQNLMNWVHAEKLSLHWLIPPIGIKAYKDPNAPVTDAAPVSRPNRNAIDIIPDNRPQEAAMKEAADIYSYCMQLVGANYGNTHYKNATCRRELADILRSFKGRVDVESAKKCLQTMKNLIGTWA